MLTTQDLKINFAHHDFVVDPHGEENVQSNQIQCVFEGREKLDHSNPKYIQNDAANHASWASLQKSQRLLARPPLLVLAGPPQKRASTHPQQWHCPWAWRLTSRANAR